MSYTTWIVCYSLTARLVPCGEVSAAYFSPALCHLWGRAALAKFLLLYLMYPHLYLFVAPMAHWNFSSARINFFKVSLICECLPKSAFTRFFLFVREASGQFYRLLLILQPLLKPVCIFLDAQVVLNLTTPKDATLFMNGCLISYFKNGGGGPRREEDHMSPSCWIYI